MSKDAEGKGPDVQKWQWTPHGMAAADDNSISWVEGRDYDALAAKLEAARKDSQRIEKALCKTIADQIMRADKAESALAAMKAERAGEGKDCDWTEDFEGTWDTECGEKFQFNEGDPQDNNFRFCHSCGKKVKATKYVEPLMDDDEPAPTADEVKK